MSVQSSLWSVTANRRWSQLWRPSVRRCHWYLAICHGNLAVSPSTFQTDSWLISESTELCRAFYNTFTTPPVAYNLLLFELRLFTFIYPYPSVGHVQLNFCRVSKKSSARWCIYVNNFSNMATLLSCQPPPPPGYVTVLEQECQFIFEPAELEGEGGGGGRGTGPVMMSHTAASQRSTVASGSVQVCMYTVRLPIVQLSSLERENSK